MKAAGSSVVVGGFVGMAGTAAATDVCSGGPDSTNDVNCFTSEDLSGLSNCNCDKIDGPTYGRSYTFGGATVEIASDGKSATIKNSGDLCLFAIKCGGGPAPGACTVVKCPSDNTTLKCSTCCGGTSISNIQAIYDCETCPYCDGGGVIGDATFNGCSQVCNVENCEDVDIVYNEGPDECDPVTEKPCDLLRSCGRCEGCWELIDPESYKIISAEGVDNPNNCADVCLENS